jgi:hypothetical protein
MAKPGDDQIAPVGAAHAPPGRAGLHDAMHLFMADAAERGEIFEMLLA